MNVHTFTINDDDKPVVTIAATDADAVESGDTGASPSPAREIRSAAMTVSFTVSGTATAATDYTTLEPAS